MSTLMVMQKGGKSYIKIGHYSMDDYRINGLPISQAKGHMDWCVIDGPVLSIEKKTRGRSYIKHYRRVDGSSERLPEIVSADSAEVDDDGDILTISGQDPRFYEAEYDAKPDEWNLVPFEVVDRDCEPVEMESWCVVDWPASVEHYRERQHLYPCHITVDSLFNLCAERIDGIVKKSNGSLILTDYRNIGTLHVDAVVAIPKEFQRARTVEYYKTFRARKTSTKVVTDDTKTIRLFDLNGRYDKPSAGSIQVPGINAANYAELEKRVAKYVNGIADLCDMRKRCVCSACGGHGIVFSQE